MKAIGPRYALRWKTKGIRFADKRRHQFFLEREVWTTHEVYRNGLSTSLLRAVQKALLATIPGLEHVEINRPATRLSTTIVDRAAAAVSGDKDRAGPVLGRPDQRDDGL